MNRCLFLLRHAEAEPEMAGGDNKRPLTSRGKKAVGLIGDRLRGRAERVQKIFSSTALRADQTARGVCSHLGCAERDIVWRPDLYLASPGDLLALLNEIPSECGSLLLVGHNPGLQNLLTYLAMPASPPADKSMFPATVAKLEFEGEWRNLRPGCARLVYLLRP